MDGDLLRFEPFELDVATGELRKHGQPVRLPPQPAKVLSLLASNTDRLVTREEIRARVWSDDTFVDFEQGLNYCIKQIRVALNDDARAPTFIETLPRRGYRFLARVERAAPVSTVPRRLLLAVVPFENLSGDPEQEYFSDGLTDEMISQLGRLNPERLGVIGRTSAMKYKATHKTIAEIGRELGVSHLLEGSVRRAGDRVRVTAQLVRVSDQTHVWTESYDRTFEDLLALQRDIAEAIAREIHVQLTPREATRLARIGTVSPQAHEAYLRGRYFWNKRTEDAFRKGIEHFTRAIECEPNFAAAYDGLCDSYVMLACRGVLPARETFQKAKDAAGRALAIDPLLGEARGSLAHVRLHDWDWEGLDADFQRALELSPGHAIAHYWYAEYLMAAGRPEEAIAMVTRAHRMDPLSPVLGASMGMIRYLARHNDEAVDGLRQALDINPDHFLLHFRLGLACLQVPDFSAAIEEMRCAVTLSGRSTESLAGLAQAYAGAGMHREMQEAVDEIMAQADSRYVSPYNMSRVHAAARDADRAFAWLERAHDEHNPDLIELGTDPVFDGIRPDPRFRDLRRRIGWPA